MKQDADHGLNGATLSQPEDGRTPMGKHESVQIR
jgi:hypothetical protein